MSEDSGNRSRPTPRPRPAATGRPSPRPRVAGARRDRDESDGVGGTAPAAAIDASQDDRAPEIAASEGGTTAATRASARPRRARAAAGDTSTTSARRRVPALALVLALLCVAAAAVTAVLLVQRLNPSYVDAGILTAARSNVEALYAYDYEDSEGSVERKLAVLTGDLREQYEADLSDGGIVDSYEQVSATTRYEVLDIGVKEVADSQDRATLIVFGQYVVQSATTGQQEAPQGSECSVTPEGAQSCVQTLRVSVVDVDGEWKIDEVDFLTTS